MKKVRIEGVRCRTSWTMMFRALLRSCNHGILVLRLKGDEAEEGSLKLLMPRMQGEARMPAVISGEGPSFWSCAKTQALIEWRRVFLEYRHVEMKYRQKQ